MTERELLSCPVCHAELAFDDSSARCAEGHDYLVEDGIPVLLGSPSEFAQQQAEWFDQEDEEWEIERPYGAPALHRWLLEEKFRRALGGIEVSGRTVVVGCAGSGMDAEFLARAGAKVIAVDISLGAARRTLERARRHGFDVLAVVADVEQLPLRDEAVDLAYVHDGLHHLEQPLAGLAELCRVARRTVCVSEPARARLTALAVRLGLALDREPAGNRVARVDLHALESALRSHGFDVVRRQRYAMYYKHEPGKAARLLSLPGLVGLATVSFALANLVVGRIGNKLAVVAARR